MEAVRTRSGSGSSQGTTDRKHLCCKHPIDLLVKAVGQLPTLIQALKHGSHGHENSNKLTNE